MFAFSHIILYLIYERVLRSTLALPVDDVLFVVKRHKKIKAVLGIIKRLEIFCNVTTFSAIVLINDANYTGRFSMT